MKMRLLALLLLASTSLLAAHVFIGFGVGGYVLAPPPVVTYVAPPAPLVAASVPPVLGPGYTWVAGYWYPVGAGWYWHPGYWARVPYMGAHWVAPRYVAGRYYAGYWRR
jgi:YXWGXW repeat-containing protein